MRFHRIYVEITNCCNLNCSFCSHDLRKKREMSVCEFRHVLDEIKDYTDTICLHIKGEPLLHSQFDSILYLCDQYHINVHLVTNGVFLSKQVKCLISHASIKKLSISLHCEQKQEDYFEQVFSTVDKLSTDLVVIYRLWAIPRGSFSQKSTEIVEKLRNHYLLSTETVHKIYYEKNIKIGKNRYVDKAYLFEWPQEKVERKLLHGTCQALKSQIGILSDGTVVPCCLDSGGIIVLGNVFEESFSSILSSERIQNIRNGFRNQIVVEKLCQNCSYKERFTSFSKN